MKYPLGFNTWDNKEITLITKVLKSGNFVMGKKVKIFEKKFAKYFRSKHAVMVNSGSSANLLMLSLIKYFPEFLKKKKIKNPNIIVPAVGWSTSYYPISQCGFKLKFVDIDLQTLNIDTKKVEFAVDKNTVAILPINLLGKPCNFKELNRIAKKNSLILLEDNCESLGATYNGKFCGTMGLMGTHSLFFAHHMQTMEGGMILTNNNKINDILRSLRAHGWARDLPNKNQLYKKKNDMFKDKFTFILPGYCVRPLEIEAAAGLVQIKKLKKFLKIRLQNSEIFKNLFKNKNWCQIQEEDKNSKSSWYGFNIILRGELENKRNQIVKKLIKNKIEVRPTMTGNFTKNPVIKFLNHEISGKLTKSDIVDKDGFFIGNYPKDLTKELKLVYKIITKELIK